MVCLRDYFLGVERLLFGIAENTFRVAEITFLISEITFWESRDYFFSFMISKKYFASRKSISYLEEKYFESPKRYFRLRLEYSFLAAPQNTFLQNRKDYFRIEINYSGQNIFSREYFLKFPEYFSYS